MRIYLVQLQGIESDIAILKQKNLGISIYTLTHLNVDPTLKRMLFKMYLELPLYSMKKVDKQHLSPWNTFLKLSFNKKTNIQELEFSFLSQNAKNKFSTNSQFNLIDFSISTQKQDLHSLRSMSNIYVKSLKKEFLNHPSELGTEKK